tara:strand:- start:2059 stop:2730 length:672 start_codon:yes stop_codon:yes gene_type:complete
MKQKPRMPRIDRDEDIHFEDDTGHLWAVSYADFLMVLLSFFILFFSTEDTNQVIERILTATEQGSEAQGTGGGDSYGRDKVEAKGAVPASLIEKVSDNFSIKVDESDKRVVFYFPDDIYRKGETVLNETYKAELASLLEILQEFANEIELEFVGHTDSIPIRNPAQKVVNDNFALSVIRATRALQYAQSLGYPSERMAAKGSAQTKRDSRTLSLIIRSTRDEL